MLIVKLAILRKVSLPSKDGYFYSTCYTFVVVNFPRNALVSFARNGWSACAGMWWSRSSESPDMAHETPFAELKPLTQIDLFLHYGPPGKELTAMHLARDNPAIRPLCLDTLQNQIIKSIDQNYSR